MIEIQKFGAVLERNLDILNHGLRMNAEQPVQPRADPPLAVPAHDFRVGDRVETPAAVHQPADQWVLGKQIFEHQNQSVSQRQMKSRTVR